MVTSRPSAGIATLADKSETVESMVVVVMGVSGSGKTTVGKLLSEGLGWKYFDADDFHPQANVEKMRSGIPLTDDDRTPWLETLGGLIRDSLERGESAVLACSALKASYREFLMVGKNVRLIYLKGDYETIQQRLSARRGHYMNPALLESQFETLEEPEQDVHVEVSSTPEEILEIIRNRLGLETIDESN